MVAMYTDIATEGTRGVSSGLETLGAGADSFTCTCLMISDLYHSLRTQRHKAAESLAGPLSVSLARHTKSVLYLLCAPSLSLLPNLHRLLFAGHCFARIDGWMLYIMYVH